MKESGGEQFLNEKYPDLQGSPEVESATKRQEVRVGEKPHDKHEKVEAYLNRLEEIFDVENPKRERRVAFLKDKLHENFVVKPEEIPESYFNHQKQIARERGYGDIEITDEMRQQMAETIVHDQAQSLDNWVDYLGSQDVPYPNWLKYFAFRSITKLSEYDKEKKEFKKRSKGTTANFPDINREALSYVLDEVKKSHKKEARENTSDEKWEKLLKTANFGKLYAHAIEKITPASEEEKENVQGEWIKYDQGSDAEPLYKSLQGHGTGWCTAGEGVAKTQLQAGDFYVFYSNDKSNQPKVPRVAIRMENGEIAEVRGINADQNLESSMTEVAKEKMKDLPGAERYEKKVEDMKKLTEIEKKLVDLKAIEERMKARRFQLPGGYGAAKARQKDEIYKELQAELEEAKSKNQVELTKEELKFLYEIDAPIEGFGYQKDPRIFEITRTRDQRVDYATIFDCQLNQIDFQDFVDLGDNVLILDDDTVVFVGNIDFSNDGEEKNTKMPKNLKYILGDFRIRKWNKIESLGQIKMIQGDADFYGAPIKDLGKLERIGGDAIFSYSGIESLGDLQYVGGHINAEHSEIKDFDGLGNVGSISVSEGMKYDFSKSKWVEKIDIQDQNHNS